MAVFPKFHSSAFSRISESQTDNLARILRALLQKFDQNIGGPACNLSLHDRPFLRRRGSYWNTIEEDFHWHIEILPQMFRITGFEWASGFFYNPVPPELAARWLSRGSQV
jgi:UDPglucose--hexose-1-phosphate uridylyltransferase